MKRNAKKIVGLFLILSILMTSLMVVNAAEPTTKPIIHLKFDDNLDDASGNGNMGLKSGSSNFSEGINGKSIELTGGYIDIKNSDKINFKNQFTISAWVKLDRKAILAGDNSPIFSKVEDESDEYNLWYGLGYGSSSISSVINFGIDPNGSYTNSASYNMDPVEVTEKWCHLAFVYDGTNFEQKYFVDGKLVDSTVIPKNDYYDRTLPITPSSRRIQIGKDYDGMLKGKIDDLRIYDKPLSDDDVISLYTMYAGAYRSKMILQINSPTMIVNNVQKEIDPGFGTCPQIISDVTFVPVRSLIESMGGSIAWDAADQRVDVTLQDKVIKLWVNRLTATVNGQTKQLTAAPVVVGERTLLPLRFVTENLGCKIEWDGRTQTITLSY